MHFHNFVKLTIFFKLLIEDRYNGNIQLVAIYKSMKNNFYENYLIFAQGQWCFNTKLSDTLSMLTINIKIRMRLLRKKQNLCQRNKPKNITSTHVRLLPEFKHINEGRKRN